MPEVPHVAASLRFEPDSDDSRRSDKSIASAGHSINRVPGPVVGFAGEYHGILPSECRDRGKGRFILRIAPPLALIGGTVRQ